MNWQGETGSEQVEDRSNETSNIGGSLGDIFGGSGSSGGFSIPMGGGSGLFGGGLSSIIIMGIIYFLMNGGFGNILGDSAPASTQTTTSINDVTKGSSTTSDALNDILNQMGIGQATTDTNSTSYQERKEFVSVVMKKLGEFWQTDLQKENVNLVFRQPGLVLYNGSTMTAAGMATKDMGPFYSPSDEKIYLDLSFADELVQKYGASGDYTMAYVLAHEYGHHIQTLLGISEQMVRLQQQLSNSEYNKYSVRMELQADYFAGMFTHWLATQPGANGKPILEEGDVDEAMRTAQSIGDDTLEKNAMGYADPDTFTHGTSAQRQAWFHAGYKYGDLAHSDTFNAQDINNP